MTIRSTLLGLGLVATTAILSAPVSAADVQPLPFKRTVLQKADLADLTGREGLVVLVEVPPGVESGRHTHPGTELGYQIEGTSVLEVEGMPPRTLGPGDSWIIPAGKVHNARGTGDRPSRVIVTYVVEKGKPLASPAP
ncbi:cupin domain-containing protein [Benzoatithermus flavus]|uniref:Cupin domain-containing protein n=1 Tax=Benzoatithermus flavus TaxID=3108223 RepID=A0ABU8XPL3_9PROT